MSKPIIKQSYHQQQQQQQIFQDKQTKSNLQIQKLNINENNYQNNDTNKKTGVSSIRNSNTNNNSSYSNRSTNSKNNNFNLKPDHNLKILLIGNSGVGKSSILMRYSQNKFLQNYYSTIGVDYKLKFLQLHGQNIKLQIWDTAGQDRFKTIVSSYYRGAHGILIVYDVTDRQSFQGIKLWLQQIQKLSQQTVVKYLIGNKNDLQGKRQVSTQQGLQFANQLNIGFKETSAKLATNIDQIFIQMTQKILGFDNNKNLNFIKEQVKQDKNVHKLAKQKPKQNEKQSSCC